MRDVRWSGPGLVVGIAVLAATGCIQEGERTGGSEDGDGEVGGAVDTGVVGDATGGEPETVACLGCVIADTCRDEGEANPQNPCELCDPARDVAGWSAADDARACEDEDPCTASGTCAEGACRAPLRAECEEAPACVAEIVCEGDDDGDEECEYVLVGGTCLIEGVCVEDGEGPVGDPCRVCEASVETRAWTSTRAACDDGDACTYEDVCTGAGECVGQPNDCRDALDCTLDFCDGGACLHQVMSDRCLVGGRCYAAGEREEDGDCLVCAPEEARESLSAAVGGACDDGDPCTREDKCDAAGSCGGEVRQLDSEPNETLASAQDVGAVGSTLFPAGAVDATLIEGDVDLFVWGMTYSNVTVFFEPRVDLELDGVGAVELCLYARCGQTLQAFEAPSLSCEDGTKADALDGKTLGCCRDVTTTEASMTLPAACLPGLTHGFAYALVRAHGAVDAASCGRYALEWGAE